MSTTVDALKERLSDRYGRRCRFTILDRQVREHACGTLRYAWDCHACGTRSGWSLEPDPPPHTC